MHDPGYYKSHYERWQKEYEAQIRAYEKSHPSAQRGFEGAVGACNGAGLEEVNANDLADQARKEREEKKQLTEGAKREGERAMPRMTVNPSKMTGVARSRHQLGTMLMEAYMNREVLEEKIAQGKRNRKEAGNKYGQFIRTMFMTSADCAIFERFLIQLLHDLRPHLRNILSTLYSPVFVIHALSHLYHWESLKPYFEDDRSWNNFEQLNY